MDIPSAYEAFLEGLDSLPNLTVIGPSFFSTLQAWPLPALTVDTDAIPLGSKTEAGDIYATGLTMPMALHLPVDMSNLRGMVRAALDLLSSIIPIIDASFGSDYLIGISDMWSAIVQFGGGEAFCYAFTLTVSEVSL